MLYRFFGKTRYNTALIEREIKMGQATTGFKRVNDDNDPKEEAKAKKEGPKSGVHSDKDRPVRNDNLTVGGQGHLKEAR